MSRSLSWIDATSLASAVSRARATPGPAGDPIPTTLSSILPASQAISAPTRYEPAPPAALAAPTFGPGAGLAERVRGLAAWVESQLGPERWYLADEEGLALHTASASDTEVLASVMLSRAMRPLRGVLGTEPLRAITIQMEGGRQHHTVWVETARGRVALGLENPARATRESLEAAADAVRQALQA